MNGKSRSLYLLFALTGLIILILVFNGSLPAITPKFTAPAAAGPYGPYGGVCDTDGDGIPDSDNWLCDTDGDSILNDCFMCDTNDNNRTDSCFKVDTSGNGIKDSCIECEGQPDAKTCSEEGCHMCFNEECQPVPDWMKSYCGDETGCSICIGGKCQKNPEKGYCGEEDDSILDFNGNPYHPAVKCKVCDAEGKCVNAPEESECAYDSIGACASCDGDGKCILHEKAACPNSESKCGKCGKGFCESLDGKYCGPFSVNDTASLSCMICDQYECVRNDGASCSGETPQHGNIDPSCGVCVEGLCQLVRDDLFIACGTLKGCEFCVNGKCEDAVDGTYCGGEGSDECNFCKQGYCTGFMDCTEVMRKCATCVNPGPGGIYVCEDGCLSHCEKCFESGDVKYCTNTCENLGEVCSNCILKEGFYMEGVCKSYCAPDQFCDNDGVTCVNEHNPCPFACQMQNPDTGECASLTGSPCSLGAAGCGTCISGSCEGPVVACPV